MIIHVDELKKDEPLHVSNVYREAELPFKHNDAVLEEPVSVDFILTHEDRDLRLGGFVETAIRYTCARCLKELSRRLSTSFDLLYMPQPTAREGVEDEIELKYEEMEVGFYDGERFDVDLMVLEQIELALPMRFICREECKGLCQSCGSDLNEGPCGCPSDAPDSRLAVLREIRRKMET